MCVAWTTRGPSHWLRKLSAPCASLPPPRGQSRQLRKLSTPSASFCSPRGQSVAEFVDPMGHRRQKLRSPSATRERRRARPGCGGERGRGEGADRPLLERTPPPRAHTTVRKRVRHTPLLLAHTGTSQSARLPSVPSV